MAKNKKQRGDVATVSAPAAVSSGDILKVNSFVGACQTDAKSGEDVALDLVGVYECAKEGAQTWAQGEPLYWDDTNKRFTKTASGNTKAGYAWADAASADTKGEVRLGLQFG